MTGDCQSIDENAIFVAVMKIRVLDNQLEIATPAKVNLFLELIARREDGFHEVENVMASVSLYDQLRFATRSDERIQLTLSTPSPGELPAETDAIPTDQSNLIHKSFQLVRSVARAELGPEACRAGIDIQLLKRIPSAAGLGGASSNSAAAIVAANHIWKLGWSKSRLERIAARLGSDIPFFLTGGTAICRGRGELINTFDTPAGLWIVVAKPSVSLSTATVFGNVQVPDCPVSSDKVLQSVRRGSAWSIGRELFNRLQPYAEPLTRQIATLREEFNRLCCLGHQMSGSGSSYFGIFTNSHVARQAARCLSCRQPDARIFCVQTLGPSHDLS